MIKLISSSVFATILLMALPPLIASTPSAEVAGKYYLKSIHGTYLRSYENEGKWVVDLAPHSMQCEQWYIEEREGKVTLRSHCKQSFLNEYLDANADLSVRMNDWYKELWTPVKNDDGSWSFQSSLGTWLSADGNNGRVYTVRKHASWEHFWLEKWTDDTSLELEPSRKPRVSRASNEYEYIEDSAERLPSASEPTTSTTTAPITTTEDSAAVAAAAAAKAVAGRRCIRSSHGRYLRGWEGLINKSDWFVGTGAQCGKCEQWYIEEHHGKVAFKSFCGEKYLRAYHELYSGYSDLSEPGPNELWTVVSTGYGKWSFKSEMGTWLRAHPHGRVSLQTHQSRDETWSIESWTEPTTTTQPPPISTTEAMTTTAVSTTSSEPTTTTMHASPVSQQAPLSNSARSTTIHLTSIFILAVLILSIALNAAVVYWFFQRRRVNLKSASWSSERNLVVINDNFEDDRQLVV